MTLTTKAKAWTLAFKGKAAARFAISRAGDWPDIFLDGTEQQSNNLAQRFPPLRWPATAANELVPLRFAIWRGPELWHCDYAARFTALESHGGALQALDNILAAARTCGGGAPRRAPAADKERRGAHGRFSANKLLPQQVSPPISASTCASSIVERRGARTFLLARQRFGK